MVMMVIYEWNLIRVVGGRRKTNKRAFRRNRCADTPLGGESGYSRVP